MRRIDCGTSGSRRLAGRLSWQDLDLGPPWPGVVQILAGNCEPRPVQALALGEQRLLDKRCNAILAAPTNAGKSLVGLLLLLDAVRLGQRAVLLEPLRAIAREKYDELQAARRALAERLDRPLKFRITTGDYRLDQETFTSPPPSHGELIVATPERFDSILRNPDNASWIEQIGCVCVDEAHLISMSHRGLTLEYVITALKCLATPPRLVLLSASLGKLEQAQAWLHPCEVTRLTERFPPLRKEVWELSGSGGEDEANQVVAAHAREVLSDASAQLLVFVYQTRSAEKLAGTLRELLDGRAGSADPQPYHASLSTAQREAARQAFLSGRSRCLIATTALGLGVNLPATHVLVRDTTFAGVGPLSAADLLQMMGRAGRGDREGHAVALVRPNEAWRAEELAAALREERLPGLTSALEPGRPARKGGGGTTPSTSAKAAPVLAQLLRRQEQGITLAEMETFFSQSLGGQTMTSEVGMLLAWLCDSSRCLAYEDEHGRYRPTVLGRRAAEAMLPLDLAAGAAQLLRDLLSVDAEDRFLSQWQGLDHLILLELLNPRSLAGRRFSEKLAEQVDGWMEGPPQRASVLYREWLRGSTDTCRASDVLGSLGIHLRRQSAVDDGARQTAYLAIFRAAVLFERAGGEDASKVERRWGVSGLEGIEERWRDETLWLLWGLSRLLEVRCFYYHLREVCSAGDVRVRRVKGLLRQMRKRVLTPFSEVSSCCKRAFSS
jgi:replicative superfamily II helicase